MFSKVVTDINSKFMLLCHYHRMPCNLTSFLLIFSCNPALSRHSTLQNLPSLGVKLLANLPPVKFANFKERNQLKLEGWGRESSSSNPNLYNLESEKIQLDFNARYCRHLFHSCKPYFAKLFIGNFINPPTCHSIPVILD